jgi:inosose dehydratase
VELGQGKVNLEEVFKNMEKIKFSGWAIVELDSVPDKSRTPKECGEISKSFLSSKVGYTFN